MPTYVYEIVASSPGARTRQFEVFQRISDPPLTHDPVTHEPVIRIVGGGIGIRTKGLKRSTTVDKKSAAATACGCGTGRSHRQLAKVAAGLGRRS